MSKEQVETPWKAGDDVWIWRFRMLECEGKIQHYLEPIVGRVTNITLSGRTQVLLRGNPRVYQFTADGKAYGKAGGSYSITLPSITKTIEEVNSAPEKQIEMIRLINKVRSCPVPLFDVDEALDKLSSLLKWMAGLETCQGEVTP